MGWRELEERFRRMREEGRLGLLLYLTVGFPDLSATLDLVPALERAGVDALELGVPFSDPLADGPTIQRASFHALRQGVTLSTCLETVARLRMGGSTLPIVLMGYYNPVLRFGLERTAREAGRAGVDGFIVADLPPEEAEPFRTALEAEGLALIPLLAPTSPDRRIAQACRTARGFVYCVSVTGVTGARDTLPPDLEGFVVRVRRHTDLGVAVGFGISRPEHCRALRGLADAVVVGSAFLQALEQAPPGRWVEAGLAFVDRLRGDAAQRGKR